MCLGTQFQASELELEQRLARHSELCGPIFAPIQIPKVVIGFPNAPLMKLEELSNAGEPSPQNIVIEDVVHKQLFSSQD